MLDDLILRDAAIFGVGAIVGALANAPVNFLDPTTRPTPLSEIYVRPNKGKYGVGLVCVRDVPRGARICKCFPPYSKTVSMASLDSLPLGVREALHEMWDCVDDPPGKCLVPIDYDSTVPLISFINHDGRRPNCEYDASTNAIRAVRALRKGEEATVDYFAYQDETSYTYLHAAARFRPDFVRTVYPAGSAPSE